MRIGSQRCLFTVMRRVQVGVTRSNEPNFVWQDWRPDVFGEVAVKRGKEQFDPVGKKRYAEDVWQFRTRYDEVAGIDATMKVSHEGNVYDIKAILPDGQRHIDCLIEATLQDGTLGGKPVTIAITGAIEPGIVGQAYPGLKISVAGGMAPYSFIVESGAIPPGLELGTNGELAGTPTQAGTYSISLDVVDANGAHESFPTFELVIGDP
ncbi:putative Ig domain-containing protein [Shinella zoogloeoides]|uniref:putative Ig domain-containing protein n=1 Tax=Shinella zoogloeoides TaxID=352475 RepID=UPI00299EA048|nr:putative Ig domain-containing protein [Shinella zoogloeoides]WPE19958.1 hypothetical protein ShzoTeo12_11380 [Shinella zoogloeoides]